MQSIDLMETYAHGMSKELICKKEKTKDVSITKQDKKWLTLMMLQKKHKIT